MATFAFIIIFVSVGLLFGFLNALIGLVGILAFLYLLDSMDD